MLVLYPTLLLFHLFLLPYQSSLQNRETRRLFTWFLLAFSVFVFYLSSALMFILMSLTCCLFSVPLMLPISPFFPLSATSMLLKTVSVGYTHLEFIIFSFILHQALLLGQNVHNATDCFISGYVLVIYISRFIFPVCINI